MAAPTGVSLLTGSSGYVGKLLVAALLRESDRRLILPVRQQHAPARVLDKVDEELRLCGSGLTDAERQRVTIVQVPNLTSPDVLAGLLGGEVREVIHCAASIDYFDAALLDAVNIEMTKALLDACRGAVIERFVYVSTAFSSGYVDRPIPEALHDQPGRDPTHYTRSKRAAEHLVASSGLPYLCVRPSIVIGDSRDGHYTGKQYGLYQLLAGVERLLCQAWEAELHAVAPSVPMHFIHQDALQRAFMAAWREAPPNSIMNMVTDPTRSPSARELWAPWLGILRPERTFFYDTMDRLPVGTIPRRQRALAALASVNLEIAGFPWHWDTTMLDGFVAAGLVCPPCTFDSVNMCQQRYVDESSRVQSFIRTIGPARVGA